MITTIKNETWGKKKLRNLDFIMPIKSTAKTEGEEKEKKSKRIYRTSQNIRILNVSLESLLSESFPLMVVTVYLTSLRCPPTLYWSLDLLWRLLRF